LKETLVVFWIVHLISHLTSEQLHNKLESQLDFFLFNRKKTLEHDTRKLRFVVFFDNAMFPFVHLSQQIRKCLVHPFEPNCEKGIQSAFLFSESQPNG